MLYFRGDEPEVTDHLGCATRAHLALFRDDLLLGIDAYGFETPFTIQQRAIIPIVKGEDTIVQVCTNNPLTEHLPRLFSGPIWYWQDRNFDHWNPAAR